MRKMKLTEMEIIMQDPQSCYASPEEVVLDVRLSREEKIAVLKRWAFDAGEREVAESENMQGSAPFVHLHAVLVALRRVEWDL